MPGPDQYDVARGSEANKAPKAKIGTGLRTEAKIPHVPGPGAHELKNSMGSGPRHRMGSKKVVRHEKDGLGPGAYAVKAPQSAPHYQFGTNLDSDIRSKNHINPRKTNKPGPGQHDNKDV